MSLGDIFRAGKIKEENAKLNNTIENVLASNAIITREFEALRESVDREVRNRGYGWQSLTDINGSNSDFTLEKHHEMQEKSKEAFFFSPAARRFVTYTTSYITGKDFEVKSSIEEIQTLIESCLKDPKNKFNRQKREWTQRFMIEGEVFVTLHLGIDGSVLLRETDTFEIKDVIRDPEDAQQPALYKRCYYKTTVINGEETSNTNEITEYILDIEMDLESVKKMGFPPEVMNNISKTKRIQHIKTLSFGNRKRGFSPLLSVLYYLQAIREDVDEKRRLKKVIGAYYLDVKVKGSASDVAAIASQKQYQRPPKSGSVLVHNEAVEHSLLNPKIDHNNDNKSIEPILQQIVIGTGMPEWMLVGMANMYKAGAQEQSGPFVKVIEDLQELFGDEYIKLMTFAIKYKLDKNKDRKYFEGIKTQKGYLSAIDDQYLIDQPKLSDDGETLVKSGKMKPFWEFIEVQFPQIISRDIAKEAESLTKDISNKLVSRKTASIKRGYDYEQEKILIEKEYQEDKLKNPLLNGELDIDHEEPDPEDDGQENEDEN